MSAALLVPAHNASACLPALAACARASSTPFAEWWCYDDDSTDSTASVAEKLGFRVLRAEKNGGPSRARNALARAAHSPWLHFHDADDLFEPGYLSQSLDAAADDACDVVVCDSSWELEESRRRVIHFTYDDDECQGDPLAYVVSHPVGVISALIRREDLLRAGGFDESSTCWEDADMFVRLAEQGSRFRMLERTLVVSIRHGRGISRNQHHCDVCRLAYLQGYARRHPRRLHPVLAAEAEKLIPRLLGHADRAAAQEALALARSLGADPPTTRHPLLAAAKRFVPALTLMAWQHRKRNPAT
jgi:glycosyltransferase involved in cell wall biosynthesis